MAMNLRLPDELATSLRDLAARTGRSQQDLAREALEEFVRDFDVRNYPRALRASIQPGDREANFPLPGPSRDRDSLAILMELRQDRI